MLSICPCQTQEPDPTDSSPPATSSPTQKRASQHCQQQERSFTSKLINSLTRKGGKRCLIYPSATTSAKSTNEDEKLGTLTMPRTLRRPKTLLTPNSLGLLHNNYYIYGVTNGGCHRSEPNLLADLVNQRAEVFSPTHGTYSLRE